MKKLRVMLLVHETLIPPDNLVSQDDPRMPTYQTEYDVCNALLNLGHEVRIIGVYDELAPIRKTIEEWQPDITFNLLEEFAGNPAFDYYVVSYLEMMKVPYTGCNPRGLLLARDKALSKKLLSYHHIKVPEFTVFQKDRAIRIKKNLPYPLIVKPLMEEGSASISQASYVENGQQLEERITFLHQKTNNDAIAEQYIAGREIYVLITGNTRLTVFPYREIVFDTPESARPQFATYKVKWDPEYRDRWGIDYVYANKLPEGIEQKIERICKRAYRILDINGYARFDLRLDNSGRVYILEANPNPAIAHNEESAFAAEKAGLTYEGFIQRILSLGLRAAR